MLILVSLGAIGWVAWDTWKRGVFQGVPTQAPEISVERLDAPRTRVDINTIVRAHLFGREPREAAPVVQKAAPPTRLNLKLVGVIALGGRSKGLALIETGRGRQQVIRVGEAIGNTGAMLSEVARDHVLIERNGRLEKLAIKRPALEADAFRPLEELPRGASESLGADDNPNLPSPSPGTFDTPGAQPFADAAAPLPESVEPLPEDPAGAAVPAENRLTLPF